MVAEIAGIIGVSKACKYLGMNRSTYYLKNISGKDIDGGLNPHPQRDLPKKKAPRYSYTLEERDNILNTMNTVDYRDQTPYSIYSSELDRGNYLCSVSTMYRILHDKQQVKERRRYKRTSNFSKPELLATKPNEVWSWDITKLKAQVKWTYFYLYVIIDIFSRFVVGWMIAHQEKASLATKLIGETCLKQDISPNQLTIHSDRGSSMTSKPVQLLLSDLGIVKSHSRPYVSDDNPFSESQFKTLKYHPKFPERFGCMLEAKHFCRQFFDWYNKQHYHSGILFLTPETVHYGQANQILRKRHEVLMKAYKQNPERFRFKQPKMKTFPEEVWINKPLKT